MKLLDYNVEQNKHLVPSNVTVQTRELTWTEGDTDNDTVYDLIVGSDLLYNITMIPALVSTLLRHLGPDTSILWAVRWRKPHLERQFFQDTSNMVEWKILGTNSCTLSWQDYGNPDCEASNSYMMQTMVSVGTMLKPLAEITEADTNEMTKEEHHAWERAQIQIYQGKVRGARGRKRPHSPQQSR